MSRAQRRKAASKALKTGHSTYALRGLTAEVRELLEEANRLHTTGNIQAAAAAYRAVLDSEPKQAQALYLLGSLMGARGDLEQALDLIQQSIAANPKIAQAHNNLAITLLSLGRRDQAEAACRRALKLRPQFADAHRTLGDVYSSFGNYEAAGASFRTAIDLGLDSGRIRNQLAMTLAKRGQNAAAVEEIREAIRLEPEVRVHHHNLRVYLSKTVPRWHFTMMNEDRRNNAYQRAIEAAVTPNSRVLEVGTGSGLLAMMAARAGAAHVTTCEMVHVIAEKAREIIAANGLADRITVLSKSSRAVNLGEDLDAACDLLVFEIFSDDLLGEGVLPSLVHAQRKLLKPGARILPAGGAMVAALVDAEGLEDMAFVNQVCGFDLSAFNEFAPVRFPLPHDSIDMRLLSDAVELFRFDFNAAIPPTDAAELDVRATASGRCIGVVQWIRVFLDADTTFENAPDAIDAGGGGESHWKRVLYCFESPITVDAGDVVSLSAVRSPIDVSITPRVAS